MSTPLDRSALTGFAVDLGGTKTAAARIEAGEIVARQQIPTDGGAGVDAQLTRVAGQLADLGFTSGAPLGLALTGRVTGDGRWYAVNTGTLSGIDGVPLAPELARRFGDRVALCNDAVAAAMGEAHFGAGRNCDAFAYMTVSTGVGGGVVLQGLPLVSPNGLAGHFGFVSSRWADRRCGSGRFATVESVASGRAIASAAERAGYKDHDARAVFEAARGGAAWAETIVDRSAAAIATLCADLASLLGLDCVALGGSVGLADGYIERVIRHLDDEPALFRPPVRRATLGQDSALCGALAMISLEARP